MTTWFLHFFLFLITTNLIPAVHSHCIEDQQLSLLHFKKSLLFDSSDSSKLITWNSSTDCCSWFGVTCSTNGHVVGLDISSESISCNIDNSSSLFQLQHLQSLNLAYNNFNGSQIPSAIGKLTNLRYLNLSRAYFIGEIPIEISRLTRLAILELSDNWNLKIQNTNLSMLFQNLTELTELNLNGVNLSAQGPHWCQAISSSLLNLRVLSLSSCGLSGPICESLAKLQSLTEIYLDSNNFYAQVPRLFANFSKLTSLNLGDSNLQGTFPKEIFQIPCLQTIDLSHNKELGGSFPEFPKNTLSLQSIHLGGTNFSGILPNSIGNLKMLSKLDLSNCRFTGSVPMSIANLTQLAKLNMSENKFNGPISAIHWESLVNLERLNLSNNLLNGSIPSSIFSLPLRGELVLSNNQFSGQLPEFSNTSSLLLETLDLGNNNLEGQIPTSIFNLQGLQNLYLSSNNFTGFPFNGPQQPRNLSSLDLSHNSLLFDYNGTGSSFLHIGSLLLASNKLTVFPDFLKNQSISEFDLSGNRIQGQIPNWIWTLKSLRKLDLSCNSLSTLEAPLPNSTSTVYHLDLHSNKIEGIHSSYSFLQLQSLDLASNKLRSFPDFLRNQSALFQLDLSNNQIQGQIPNWNWRPILDPFQTLVPNPFQRLKLNLSCNSLETLEAPLRNSIYFLWSLDLHSNKLQGQIPMFVSGRYLDYSRNNFSSIPTDIGDFIFAATYLSLSSNNLHGAIPKSICNASGQVLDLSNNSLSGIIPQCLTQAKSLSVLDLRRNSLTGTIPDNFLENCELRTLDLSRNQIQGQFPKSLVNCSKLEVLNLGNNQITETFPCLLMSISTLRILVLRFNKFYGSIECPNWKTNDTWPVLQIIDLAHNNLSGKIPGRMSLIWQAMVANGDDSSTNLGYTSHPISVRDYLLDRFIDGRSVVYNYRDAITAIIKGLELEYKKILTIFTLIDFSFNNFNGSIPEEMGQLKSLHALNLSGNALTGEIPSSFGNMQALESLDLSQNHLRGQIPPQLASLTFLSFLNLSSNQLTGRIPTGTQFSTFPNTSFEGNKGLWGPPLTADTVAVRPPPKSNGSLSNPNSGDEIDWDIISVEIGFICGFGVAVGSLLFCKRWRKWYYKAMCSMLFKIFPQLEQRFGNHTRHVYVRKHKVASLKRL